MRSSALLWSLTAILFLGCQSIDSRGFDPATKIHTATKTRFDKSGYDIDEFDRSGFNKQGFNRYGFGKDGFNPYGFDDMGYDKDGLDKNGFNKSGVCKETGTLFDKSGFDRQGVDSTGFDRGGYDIKGINRSGIPKKVFVVFTSEYFIKDLKIDGFTVDWPTATTDEFIVDRLYSITRPLPKSNPTELAVETDIVVEYVNFAMNGFGRHSNESFKKRKIRIKYLRGTNTYVVPL